MVGVRLRQAVLAAAELDPAAAVLRAELGLGEPFADPGVAEFGLYNAVFALGDAFIEIVAPAQPDTAVGRHLARHGGDGGYMVIVQLEDLEGARTRVGEMGVRVIWRVDLPDISGTHLHPSDMRGAILSLDRPEPAESWRWAGPDWTGRAGTGAPGRLVGVTLAVRDPEAVAARWGEVLGVPAQDGHLALDGGEIAFAADPAEPGLVEIAVALPAEARRGRDEVKIGGVRFRMLEDNGEGKP